MDLSLCGRSCACSAVRSEVMPVGFRDLPIVDFFTVPTIGFRVLYVFLVLAHERRRVVHFNVTAHPTAEWTAQQLREALAGDW